MNHSISLTWSSLFRTDGWNSSSIHFLAAPVSAPAGAEKATSEDAAMLPKTKHHGIVIFTALFMFSPRYGPRI